MRVQCSVLDLFRQRVAPIFWTRTTTTDQQTGLPGGIVVIHVLEEPLPGRGLCEGLDISLHEEVVLGLRTCVGGGFVIRHYLLIAEYTVLLLGLEEVEG